MFIVISKGALMEELLERGCGLDVHKKTIVACIMMGFGKKTRKETRTFGTTTEDLEELGEWLKENNIEHVAVESTSVYWLPIFNVLGDGFDFTLANARHIKNVPGRKTDVKDSEWICKLLKCGLIQKSFIPPEPIRHLRDLTRYRSSLIRNLCRAKNHYIKLLESKGIKLSSVFSDPFGKTARKLLEALMDGETNFKELLSYIPGQVKASKKEIRKALKGNMQNKHCRLLRIAYDRIIELENAIKELDAEIGQELIPYAKQVELLKTIPGVGNTAAAIMIAELGTNMDQFPTAQNLASWAGMAPGNNESAGKNKNARINPGNKYLKVSLLQSAWAAIRQKDTFWHATYHRKAPRIGKKKAAVAIGHKILIVAYYMLKNNVPYYELGPEFGNDKLRLKRIEYHTQQLEQLTALAA